MRKLKAKPRTLPAVEFRNKILYFNSQCFIRLMTSFIAVYVADHKSFKGFGIPALVYN